MRSYYEQVLIANPIKNGLVKRPKMEARHLLWTTIAKAAKECRELVKCDYKKCCPDNCSLRSRFDLVEGAGEGGGELPPSPPTQPIINMS